MPVTTIGRIADAVGADLGVFARDLDIPIITTDQTQGDLVVMADDGAVLPATRPLKSEGETVIVGNGGNSHILAGLGVMWEPGERGQQTLGTLTVPDGAVAYLFHATEKPRRLAEHQPNAIGAGTYVIRRQREQADVIRLVAD